MLVLTAPKASLESLGLMASLLRSLLRPGESLYRVSEKGLGMILPGLELNTAASFARHVEDQLGWPKGELEVAVTAYPEPAASLAEMEHLLRTPQSA